MRNLTEHNMTEAVLARLDQCEDPRLKQILSLLAKHLHGFVREAELTGPFIPCGSTSW